MRYKPAEAAIVDDSVYIGLHKGRVKQLDEDGGLVLTRTESGTSLQCITTGNSSGGPYGAIGSNKVRIRADAKTKLAGRVGTAIVINLDGDYLEVGVDFGNDHHNIWFHLHELEVKA